jgi:hypothetical protein
MAIDREKEQDLLEIYNKKISLMGEIADLTGDEITKRKLVVASRWEEIKAMDASIVKLQLTSWLLQDQADAHSKVESAASRYLSALRDIESDLASAKSAYISGLREEQQELETAANNRESYYKTGLGLAEKLAEAAGDEAAASKILAMSRELELAAMDDSLHPLQQMVWALEDAGVAALDFTKGIESIQSTIDSIMGASDSVQSRDYMTDRYNELLTAAQEDPAKAGEFASFSKTYMDFMEDYGDPKSREKVLKDLWDVEEKYTKEQTDLAEEGNDSLVDMTEAMEDLYSLQEAYQTSKDSFDNNWYSGEIALLEEQRDLAKLKNDYDTAKAIYDANYSQAMVDELEAVTGASDNIADLLQDYLTAGSGAALADTAVDIHTAITGLWDNISNGPLGSLFEQFFGRDGSGSVIPKDDGGSIIPKDDGGSGSVIPKDDGGSVIPKDDGGRIVDPRDEPSLPPEDKEIVDGKMWADHYVTDLYAKIGRGPTIGNSVNQIDSSGYYYWRDKAVYGEFDNLLDEFTGEVRSYMDRNEYETTLPGTLAHWIKNHNSLGFATGGSFQVGGPSGTDNLFLPQMRVTAGEVVNISRQDVMAELVKEIKNLGKGDVLVKVFVGNKEIKDVTIETIRTDPQAQQVIKRVANV